ncbi:MAG: Methanogenesis regulatory protein FilR1 [Methanonatronarchaeales archaeon]|nr:Methanogenesis regulatory protein FilR1 [Methanonatronarchaeales archaeon]
MGTMEVVSDHKKFWEMHDLGSIPVELKARFYELGDVDLVEHPPERVYEPHESFFEIISQSSRVRGISPVFHPFYSEFFLNLVERGIEVDLILTESVFGRVVEDSRSSLDAFLEVENASMYVTREEVRLASAVTDVFFSLSLFLKTGQYDSRFDVTSRDASARS